MPAITDHGNIRRETICSPGDCAAIAARLREVRAHWTERGSAFFTLGAATYLDVCGGGGNSGRYDFIRAQSNPLLLKRFGDLLESVRTALERDTGQTCRFESSLALPGFHIFLAPSLHQRFRDNLHLDLQHNYLPFDANLFTPTLTFTLPVAVPAAGAGIEFCFRNDRDPRGTLHVEPYRLGELLIHSGRALHRRAHLAATDLCERITLQGHGLFLNGAWTLYW